MKFLLAVAAFATVAALAQAGGPPPSPVYPNFANCATGSTDQTVTGFTVTPDYCIGKNYTLTFTGPLSAPIIEGAQLQIIGRYLNKIVYSDNNEPALCPLLAAAGTPCPVPVTTTSWSIQRLAKPSLPNGVKFGFEKEDEQVHRGAIWFSPMIDRSFFCYCLIVNDH